MILAREDLKMIISEVHRCKTIVADLLNFARQHEISAQDVDLHALLDDVILKAAHQAAFREDRVCPPVRSKPALDPGRRGPITASLCKFIQQFSLCNGKCRYDHHFHALHRSSIRGNSGF